MEEVTSAVASFSSTRDKASRGELVQALTDFIASHGQRMDVSSISGRAEGAAAVAGLLCDALNEDIGVASLLFEVLRINLRAADPAVETVWSTKCIAAMLQSVTSHSRAAEPALKCLVNLQMHGKLKSIKVEDAAVSVLRHRCVNEIDCPASACAVASHLLLLRISEAEGAYRSAVEAAEDGDLLAVVALLLVQCLLPSVPVADPAAGAGQWELAAALLKLIPAIRSREDAAARVSTMPTSLREVFAEVLTQPIPLPPRVDLRPLAVRALAFLTDPDYGDASNLLEFADHLESRGGVAALVAMLNSSLEGGAVDNVTIVPLLMVLTRLVTASGSARSAAKAIVFPHVAEAAYRARMAAAPPAKAIGSEPSEDRMRPVDSPPGTLRSKLISLITSLDTHLKRCSSELLLELCGQDMEEFTVRVGYGNAAYMLHVRGALLLSGSH